MAEITSQYPDSIPPQAPVDQAAMLRMTGLDCAPLSLALLAEVLRATREIVAEELVLGGGHDILTATDVVRDRQLRGQLSPVVPPIDTLIRLQIAQALCAVLYPRMPIEPVNAVMRWQQEDTEDRAELAAAIEKAIECIDSVASIMAAEAARTLAESDLPGR